MDRGGMGNRSRGKPRTASLELDARAGIDERYASAFTLMASPATDLILSGLQSFAVPCLNSQDVHEFLDRRSAFL